MGDESQVSSSKSQRIRPNSNDRRAFLPILLTLGTAMTIEEEATRESPFVYSTGLLKKLTCL